MAPSGGDELQGAAAAQIHAVPLLHHPEGQGGVVGDVGQVLLAGGGAQDGQVGAGLQQLGHAARVVGLVVVHDQIVNLLQGEHLLDVGAVLVPVVGVDGLHQHVLLAGEQIGVVAGAVRGGHDNVENTQAGVQYAHRVEALGQLNGTHSNRSPFYLGRHAAISGPPMFSA